MSNKKLLDSKKKLNREVIKTNNFDLKLKRDAGEKEKKTEKENKINKFNLVWGISNIVLSGFLIVLATPAATNLIGINNNKNIETLKEKTVLPVETLEVERIESYQVNRDYSGKIEANQVTELGFERSGQLERVVVREGQEIKKGMPVAYLDTRILRAQERELIAQRSQEIAKLREMQAGPRVETIEAARASVRTLQAQLELVRRQQARRQSLYAQGAISKENLDEFVYENRRIQALLEEAQSRLNELLAGTRPEVIQAQRARVEQLNASLENVNIELEKSILRAPFDGTVSARRVDEGSAVSGRQAILRIVENQKIEAKIGIPIETASQIELGSWQNLQINGRTYPAQVSSILPELDSRNRTVTIVLTLDKGKYQDIWPGQVAQLEVKENNRESGYWVPTTALVRGSRGLWSTYVLGAEVDGEDGKNFQVERRYVDVIHTESERVFVRGTLQAGDRVIVNGTHRLVPGQLVKSLK